MSFEVSLVNEIFYVLRNSCVFQFNIEQAFSAERIEDIGQERDRLAESGVETAQLIVCKAGDAASTVGGAVDCLVMDHHDPAVRAAANVELHAVRTILKRFLE